MINKNKNLPYTTSSSCLWEDFEHPIVMQSVNQYCKAYFLNRVIRPYKSIYVKTNPKWLSRHLFVPQVQPDPVSPFVSNQIWGHNSVHKHKTKKLIKYIIKHIINKVLNHYDIIKYLEANGDTQ